MELINLSLEKKKELLEDIAKKKASLSEDLRRVQESDRFPFFVPSTGEIGDKERAFLNKWLRPEDIPQSLIGIKEAMASTKKIVGIFGGNRSGKTVANAILTHIKVTREIPDSLHGVIPPMKLKERGIVYGRVYGLSSQVIEEVLVPKFKEWMPKKYWHRDGWEKTYNKQDKILRYYKFGYEFVGHVKFISCEQDVEKVQGVDLDFAHFDEEPPQSFYEETLARFGTTNLDIAFFMTPTNGMSWIFDTLFQANSPDVETFKVSTITNKYINLDSLDIQMQQTGSYEERKMRLLGEFVSLSGLIYSGECGIDKQIHVIKPKKLDWYDHVVYRGLDLHLAKETACVEVAVTPNNKKIVVGVYWKKADTDELKKDLAQRAIERGYRLGWTRYDKSLDYEIKILNDVNVVGKLKSPPNPVPAMIPSEKYKGSIMAGVDEIKQDLKINPITKEPGIYFFDLPEVWLLIKDIMTLERERGHDEERTGVRDRILEAKKDRHAALRYAYQGRMKWIEPESTDRSDYRQENYI